MKNLTKISLISSIVLTIGLGTSHSHADQDVKKTPKRHKRELITKSPVIETRSVNVNHGTSNKLLTANKNNNHSTLVKKPQQPLLKIQTGEFVNSPNSQNQKKNVIFEFTTKFNDKLQQILEIL